MVGSRRQRKPSTSSASLTSPPESSQFSRPVQRCYGTFAESSGVRRFRAISSSGNASAIIFSPPSSPLKSSAIKPPVGLGEDDCSPLSPAASSPLILPGDSEDEKRNPRSSSVSSSSLQTDSDFTDKLLVSSSPVGMRRSRESSPITSPMMMPPPPSVKASVQRQAIQSHLQSVMQSDAEDDTVETSPCLGRGKRAIKKPIRSPVLLGNAIRRSSQVSVEHTAEISTLASTSTFGPASESASASSATRSQTSSAEPTPAMTAAQSRKWRLEKLRQRNVRRLEKIAGPSKERDATPPASSERLADILSASQSRPAPPAGFPGRSVSHANGRPESEALIQRKDGSIVKQIFSAAVGDSSSSSSSSSQLPRVELVGVEQDETSEDVVFELLRGYRRPRVKRRRTEGSASVAADDSDEELHAFFNDVAAVDDCKSKRVLAPLVSNEADGKRPASDRPLRRSIRQRSSGSTTFSKGRSAIRSSSISSSSSSSSFSSTSSQRTKSSESYSLPSAKLRKESFYARSKREEASPTPEIRSVRLAAAAAAAAATAGNNSSGSDTGSPSESAVPRSKTNIGNRKDLLAPRSLLEGW